jgi:anti-sigma factor RsiW
MNMNCPIESHNPEMLVAYAGARLDARRAQVLEQHLAECEACRTLAGEQQALWTVLDTWQAPACSPDFDRRLYRRIDAEMRVSWWQRAFRPFRIIPLRRVLPVTAMAGMLLIAGLVMRNPGRVGAGHAGEAVRADQVERTLHDLELLRQFSSASSSEGGHADAM